MSSGAHDHLERPSTDRCTYDELLCTPADDSRGILSIARQTAEYVPLDARFKHEKRQYDRQYAQLYYARLMVLGPQLRQMVQRRWPSVPVKKILDVGEDTEAVVMGTVFKDMKLRPSILDEYTKDRSVKAALASTSNFCSEEDSVILEDEGARMALRGDAVPVQHLVTGVVMAVKGYNEPGGDFVVQDVCYAGVAPQPPLPLRTADQYIAVMSGVCLGSPSCDMLRMQLAVDFLAGNLGSKAEQDLAGSVVRLVVAGGMVGALEQLASAQPFSRQHSVALQPVKDMDLMLTELASALPVAIMPGADDPTNCSLPQQPLHRCLFPGSCVYSSLQRVTNPHEFEVAGVRFLGTSGQNVEDMAKYCQGTDRLAMMEHMLTWRHMAPTAPDSLVCYPYFNDDPFIVHTAPHVFFAGNQPEFATSIMQGPDGQQVRLVAVPSFQKTGQVLLVNLRTLQCHPLTFNAQLDM